VWKSHYTHAPDRALPATARSVRCVDRSYHRDASHAAPLHGELYLQRCYSLFKVPEEKTPFTYHQKKRQKVSIFSEISLKKLLRGANGVCSSI